MYRVVTSRVELQEIAKDSQELSKALRNTEIYSKIEMLLDCLNLYYGAKRDLEKDLGGYITLVYGSHEEIKKTNQKILAYHNLNSEDYEFEDIYRVPECLMKVTFRLFLCSADYSVEIVTFEKEE